MRIICPTCASHYEVELEKIAAQGQLVRCARCREVWLVRSPEQIAAAAAVAAVATEIEAAEPPAPIQRPSSTVSVPVAEVIDFQTAKVRLRRRGQAAQDGRGRATSLSGFAAGAVLLASLMSLYGFRGAVIGHLPAAGRVYAAIGLPAAPGPLALRDVHSVIVAEGGERVLTLEGRIANVGTAAAAVPGITVVVRSAGQTPLYTWTTAPPKPTLASGETIDFRARLDSPPKDGHDVRVSFADVAGKAVAALDP